MTDALERIRAFVAECRRRCATDLEPTAFGTAFLNRDFPRRYDSNFVLAERPGRPVDADAVAADADRALGEHGLAHRKVIVDDDRWGTALAPGFLELDWSAEPLLAMALVREPEPRPAVRVAEVGFDRARPVLEEVLRRLPWGRDEETCRQLVEYRALLERRVGARFFVAEVDGRRGAVCEAYSFDGVTQIEDVNTFEELRGRGLGSAVVLAAARSARERGDDVVFLEADQDDWPNELYRRLGFDVVARSWSFGWSPDRHR